MACASVWQKGDIDAAGLCLNEESAANRMRQRSRPRVPIEQVCAAMNSVGVGAIVTSGGEPD
jgi:hypothetical protein